MKTYNVYVWGLLNGRMMIAFSQVYNGEVVSQSQISAQSHCQFFVFFPLFLSIMYSCYEVTYNKNLICTQSKSVGALRVNLWLSCILCYWFSIFRHLMQNYAGAQCMFRTYLDLKLKGGTKEHHCRGYGSDWDRTVYHPWYLMGLAKMSQCKSQNYSQDRKEKKH